MKTSINMAAYDTSVKVLGPGKRFVVWFQGCPFNCPSCINQSFKDFTEATIIEVKELQPENQLRGHFMIECENLNIQIFFTLTPEASPKIQEYNMRVIKKN